MLGDQLAAAAQRRRVGRVAQQRLADALAEDPGLAARRAEDRPLALVAVACRGARRAGRRSPRSSASSRPVAVSSVEAGEAAAPCSRAVGLERDLDVLAARPRAAVQRAAAAASARSASSRAARPASRASSSAASAESGWWRTRHRRRSCRSSGAARGGSNVAGDALAPRRRAQPGEVDDVGAASRAARARERRPSPASGSSTESSSTTWASAAARRRPRGGRAATRRTSARSVTTSGSTIGSRCARCLGPHVDDDVSRSERELAGLAASPSAAIVAVASSVVRPRLDRADDRARRVVAADAAQAVGDLAAPLRSTTHDEVEHARRDVARRSRAWRSSSRLAQRRLDRGGRRVLLAPDGVGRSAGRLRSPPVVVAVEQVLSASSGPCVPASYGRQRSRRRLPRARRSGRRSATAPRPRRCG